MVDTSRAALRRLGREGVFLLKPNLVPREGAERFAAIEVPKRSTVGAGESMVAVIVLALARGCDPCEAVRFGMAAGAAALMTPGTELCRREDVKRLYAQAVSGTG